MDTAAIRDADGTNTFTYQWQGGGNDISGATDTSLVRCMQAEVGQTITVQVSYIDGGGTTETLTATPTTTVANINDAPTGLPTISGTPTQGGTLRVDTAAIRDADGTNTFTYQWQGGGNDISGATDTLLVLTQAQVGQTITVQVSYIDGGGTTETLTATPTTTVANINDAPTGLPTISGTPTQGGTLRVDTAAIRDADGTNTFTYQWQGGGNDISGATDTLLVLTQAQVGQTITVQVSYIDGGGTTETLTATPTTTVANINDAPTGLPTISGTPTQGGTLRVDTAAIRDADGTNTFTYQWQGGGNDISGATDTLLVLMQAEVGQTITVQVSYIDGGGTTETLTATPTTTVANINDAPTGLPTISGTPTQGGTLRVDTAAIRDADGTNTFTYQWQGGGNDISGATDTSLVLMQAEVGQTITVQVSYIDGGGTTETLTATPTTTVANINDAPTGLPTISGTPTQGGTLRVDTAAISDADGVDTNTFTYQWLGGGREISYAPSKPIDPPLRDRIRGAAGEIGGAAGEIIGATSPTFVLTQAQVGQTMTVRVRYIDGGGTTETLTAIPTDAVSNDEEITGSGDEAPTITSSTFTIAENAGDGATVGTITGTATEMGTTLTYSITAGNAGVFALDSTTGVITVNGKNKLDYETTPSYSLTVAVSDGSLTATATVAITVTDVTESATFTIAGLVNAEIQENTPYTGTPTITGTPVGTVTWALAGADTASFTIDTTTGVVSMTARDYEAPVDADRDNIYSATVTVTDSDSNHATQDIAITVTDVTESATFTIAGLVNAEIQENTPYTGTPTITGTPVGTVTWALAGADTASFTIDTTTGVVSMTARDYEAPVDADRDNIYSATVTVTDSDSNHATQDIAITVTDVTESATFTIAGLVNAEIQENTPYTGTPTITGTPVGTVTWALAGADTASFTIDTTTGVVSMTARDYEAPVDADRDNIYSATVTVTDSDSNEASVNIAITVTDVTESATFTIAGLVNAEIQENTPYTGTPTITGTPVGTVTWALAGADTASFTIDTTTGVVSMTARDYEAPVDADRDNIYSATVTVTDSDSNHATQDIAITVTDVTESATFTIAGLVNAEIQENTPYTGTPTITGTPVGTVTWALAGADTASFTIDTTTGVVSMTARDYEAPVDADRDNIYSATVTVTDSDSNEASVNIAITVTDVTESATFTIAGLVNAEIQENTPYTGTPTITGTPVGTVTWALAGADTASFTIDTTTGVVSMTARDYEAPVDADRDNIYSATVTVTDSDSNHATQDIAITVTDVTESATFTIAGLVNAEIQENTPYTGTPTITGTPVGTVTWALAGADTASFTIDTTTGVVSMTARDYEAPVDADRDNIYSATVTVTDSDSNEASVNIAITVTDVNEAPTIAGTPPATIAEDTAYRFIPEGGDKDANDMPVYSLSNNPAWLSVDADMGELSGTPANADVGEYTDIVLTITSGGASATLTFSIEVTNTNDAGTLTISGTVGEGDTLIASVADADGIEGVVITYQWQAGTVVIADATSNTYTLTRAEVGKTITVTARYTDQHGTTETLTVTTDVVIYAGGTVPDNSMPSGLPQIFGTPTQGAELVAVIGGIKDADGADGPFTYQWLGAGSAISGATDTFLVLTQAQVGQTITVTVSYTDGGDTDESLTSAPTGVVANVNDAPTITGTPTTTVAQDAEYSFTPTGTDVDGDTLTYSMTNTPPWAAFNTATGTLSGTPTNTHIGITEGIFITVSDGTLTASLSTFSIIVTDVNEALTITDRTFTIAENAGDGATVGTITGTATDADTTLTYSMTAGNTNDAFALDSATGIITVNGENTLDYETTPSYSLTVAVSDGSLTATATVTINVTNVNEAPTITSSTFTIAENADDGAMVGTITGTATDADTTLTYSMTAGHAGVFALDSATGVITVNGENTLDYETTPSYSLTVAVSDGSLTATATVTINVTNVNEAPTITSSTFTIAEDAGDGATVGTLTGTATDADTTLTYSMTAGNTNDAFALDSATGIITVNGDHQLDYETTPFYSLMVTVSDGNLEATATVTITVTDIDESATFTITGLVDDTVQEGEIYTSATPTTAGATPVGTLTWTLSGDDVAGCTIDDAIGVVSMIARDFELPVDKDRNNIYLMTVTATDRDGNEASANIAITVTPITNKKRIKQLNKAIMPRLAQIIIANSAVSVEHRVDTEFSNAPRITSYQLDGSSAQLDGESALDSMQNTVEQKLPTYIKALKDETLDWKRMLGNSSFVMSLDSGDGTGFGATVWGSGAYTGLDSKSDAPDVPGWHGDVFSIQLGVDKRVHDDLLVGGLVSWSEGDVDYTLAGERGKYTHQVISVHPYLAWSHGDVKLWGSAGYGRGNLAIEENDVISTTDTDLLSLLVGVKKPLSPASGLSIKSDIALVHTRINESVRIAEQDISSQRLRLLLVVEREYHWDSGGVFKPVAGIGLRYDGGAGDTGAGVELNMTMHYDNPITGLAVWSQAHALLGRDDYKDWGVQGVISLDSGADERGLSFKLSPSYGNTDSRMGEIWRQGLLDKDSDDSGGNQDDGARMEAYLGYGLSAPNGRGLLLPYGEMTVGDSRSYRLGLHWKPSMWFDMNIVGERSEVKGTASRSYWLGLHWKRSTWFDVNIVGERREGNGTANHKILLESRIRL